MVGPGLLRVVTELAERAQQARTADQLLHEVGAGLEELRFDLAVLALTREQTWFQYLTPRPALRTVGEALGLVGTGPKGDLVANPMLLPTPLTEGRAFFEDFPQALRGWLGGGVMPDGLKRKGLVAPLLLGERGWGGVVFMHDELDPGSAEVLSLFALQLGSALVDLDREARLQQYRKELELVHRLAVAGPRSDTAAMCQGALKLVCEATHSDMGALHRYDAPSRHFHLVGNSHTSPGSLEDKFARFAAPEEVLSRARCIPVSRLPMGAAEAAAAGYTFVALVPLLVEGATVGVLTLGRKGPVNYSDADVRLAEILGIQVTSLIERARLYDESRRLLRVSVEAYDELARTQAELVRHERLVALGELAAVMAHEVRNPLGVIFNSLATLKRLVRPSGDTEMLLEMVEEEAERLNRIVSDLLDFVRPYELSRRPMEIAPMVEAAVAEALQALPDSAVKVATVMDAELPPFPADSHLLKQAVVNLVTNAVQAMPKGGTVTVRAKLMPRPGGRWLELEVTDEGQGLDAKASEKLFQPFFTTKATGTGLGLAVVKRIVESHQGEVVVSANSERGTTFVVRLPPTYERDPFGGEPPGAEPP